MSAIQKGDLVTVLRGFCGCAIEAGSVGTISEVVQIVGAIHVQCTGCRKTDFWTDALELDSPRFGGLVPRAWVKKIEPLPEEETQDNREEITA